ncbi:MAG: ARPP-1 family domain-containing protein [Saprospiraceae bacterium]
MKNVLLFAFFMALALSSCVNDAPISVSKGDPKQSPLSLLTEENPSWKHENLRLYPVVASSEVIAANARLQDLKTLAEGMQMPGFRIMEQKQFGRAGDAWYHGLTVQNKTQDTVLLLSGDVVKGGNQDRVIAYHQVILPMTVRNIEVFCVEAGRSTYYDPSAPAVEKEAAAFKGYYNVASPQVRKAVQNAGNQQEVWDAVAKVTKANNAESSTKAYTALDNESAEKTRRDAYLRQLDRSFASRTDVVGMVAVCGDQVLGVDIFGNPDLFRRQYTALLHGYVAETVVAPSSTQVDENQVQKAFEKVSQLASAFAKSNENAGKFTLDGSWVHLFSK